MCKIFKNGIEVKIMSNKCSCSKIVEVTQVKYKKEEAKNKEDIEFASFIPEDEEDVKKTVRKINVDI